MSEVAGGDRDTEKTGRGIASRRAWVGQVVRGKALSYHEGTNTVVNAQLIILPLHRNGKSKASLWRRLDALVAQTTMPEEFQSRHVSCLCNDCGSRFDTTFHIHGLQCTSCGGYNTRRV